MACGYRSLLSAECWGSGLDVAGDRDVTERAVGCTSRDKETVLAGYAARCVWQPVRCVSYCVNQLSLTQNRFMLIQIVAFMRLPYTFHCTVNEHSTKNV